jgi:hypothetical protein
MENRALQISVTVRNESQIALFFPYRNNPQPLRIGQANAVMWKQACKRRSTIFWEKGIPQQIEVSLAIPEGVVLDPSTGGTGSENDPDLLGDRLEPGEQWARSALVPVARDCVAYLLLVKVGACRHVAPRQAAAHKRNCCGESQSPNLGWRREIYVLPEE